MTRMNTSFAILASIGLFGIGICDANAGNLHDIATSCTWTFGRTGGAVYTSKLKLEDDGTVSGYTHPNEATWRIEDGHLVVIGSNGRVTTRYENVIINRNVLYLTGPLLPKTKITHYMKCHN